MAGNKIEVVIDVKTEKVTFAGGEVKNLRQQAKLLNDELQRTKVGTKEYQLLVEAIGDVEDATRRAKTATQEIYGTLGSLPGPIGDITNNANKMVDTFKTLGTLKTSELRAQFVTLGKDLKDAGQGLLNITGFSKIYQGVLERISSAEKAKATAMKAATAAEQQEAAASQASAVANKEQAVTGAAAAAATNAEATAAKGNAASQVAQATAMQGASLAAKGLAAAMALLPFVFIAMAVTYLTTKLMGLFDNTEENEKAQKAYNEQLAEYERHLNKINSQIDVTASMEKALQTARNKRALTDQEKNVIEKEAYESKMRNAQSLLDAQKRNLDVAIKEGESEELLATRRKDIQKAQDDINAAKNTRQAKAFDNVTTSLEKGYAKRDADAEKAAGKAAARIQKEAEDRKKALEDIAKAEADAFKETLDQRDKEIYEVNQKYSALEADAIKYGKDTKILEEARLAALKKLTDKYAEEDKKKKEDAVKVAKDNANKLLDIQKSLNESLLDAMKTGTAKEKAEAKASGEDKIAAFKKQLLEAQELKLLTAEEVALKLAEYVKNVNDAIDNQIKDIDKKDLSKKLDEQLNLLQIQSEGLLAGTQAYFDNRRAIINASEKKELEDTELTEAEKTAIQEKYARQRNQLRKEEVASTWQTISATIDALASVTSALASGYDEEAKTSKDAFEKRKKLQIATAAMSAASGIIQILTQPSTLPSPFDWIVKGINALALGVATVVNINKIKQTQFQAPDTPSATTTAPAATGRKFADGGLLIGPSHSSGGIKTRMGELEGGEYVINRRSTASFLPMLNAINSAGKRKYADGGMTASMDQLQTLMMNQATPIVKTYVVASDIYGQAEADKKLADLARL